MAKMTKPRHMSKRTAPKNWRVKKYLLRITSRKVLHITLRKTQSKYRSKKTKQFVVYPPYSSVKEIVFEVKRDAKTKRTPKTYTVHFTLKQSDVISYVLILVGLIGTGVFSYTMVRPKMAPLPEAFAIPVPEEVEDYSQPAVLPRSQPKRLVIGDIEVDVPIEQVGKNSDGTMETPDVLRKVTGWYKYSPTPGEVGPAIIAGHVDSYEGPSVFWRLYELEPGDKITVYRVDGSAAVFKVSTVRQFEQDQFPASTVYGDIEHAGLRLITCGGVYNHDQGHYSHNTVVFASLQAN